LTFVIISTACSADLSISSCMSVVAPRPKAERTVLASLNNITHAANSADSLGLTSGRSRAPHGRKRSNDAEASRRLAFPAADFAYRSEMDGIIRATSLTLPSDAAKFHQHFGGVRRIAVSEFHKVVVAALNNTASPCGIQSVFSRRQSLRKIRDAR
jgi:hypothetical protein